MEQAFLILAIKLAHGAYLLWDGVCAPVACPARPSRETDWFSAAEFDQKTEGGIGLIFPMPAVAAAV